MFVAPDGEELAIANAASEYLGEAMPLDRLHRPGHEDLSASSRASLGQMGWFALALPEGKDGSGLSAVEHTLFFREAGRLCGPVDLLAQCLASHVAPDDLRAAILAGDVGVALLARDGASFRLIGSHEAAYGLLVEQSGAKLFALDGERPEARASLDLANSQRIVHLEKDAIASAESHNLWELAQLGIAAMLVGLSEAALEQLVDYAKVRETFGRKIGSYQAVRHPCAEMALRTEAARCQLWFAAACVKEERSDATVHLDAAKLLANEAALANADSNIQLHGGIGVTDEHHAHLFLKHALLLSKLFGSKRNLLSNLLDARIES